MKNNSSSLGLGLFASVFFAIFFFGFFLLQNLPFQFGDDLNTIDVAKNTPWSTIVRETFNPLTPAWYVHGSECLLTTRAFLTLLSKITFELFGYNPNAFWALKILGFAATGAMISLILYLVTQSKRLSLLAGLFFCSLPPVYRTVSWIADSTIVAEAFLAATFYFYLLLYVTPESGLSQKNKLNFLSLIICAWFGMKLRETVRMIPFVFLGHMLLHQNLKFIAWLKQGIKNKLLLLITILFFIPVIPWKPAEPTAFDTRSHLAVFQFKIQNILMILWPVFKLVGGAFLFAFLGFIAVRFFRKPEPENSASSGILSFFLIWSVFVFTSFGLNFAVSGNIRYLTTLLIPLTLLSFYLYAIATKNLKRPIGKYLHILFGIFVLVSFQRNLDEVIFLRNYFGGVDIADYLLTKKLFEDRYNIVDASWKDLDDFYRGRGAVISDDRKIKIKEWDENEKEKLNPKTLNKMAEELGAVYILSFNENLLPNNQNAENIYRTTTANGSFFSWLLPKIKKKTHRPIYLYKYTP